MMEMERHAIQEVGISGLILMENAARSVADWVEEHCLQQKEEAKIVVCCGKGNNGGDGFAIARLLKNRNYNVIVVDAGPAKTKDAKLNQNLWRQFGNSVSYTESTDPLPCPFNCGGGRHHHRFDFWNRSGAPHHRKIPRVD